MSNYLKALIFTFGCFISNLSFGQVIVDSKVNIEQITGERLVLKSSNFYGEILEFEYYNPFKHVPIDVYHGYRIFEFKKDGHVVYEDTKELYECGNDMSILYFKKANWEQVEGNAFRFNFEGGMSMFPYVRAAVIYKTYATKEMTYIFEKIKVEVAEAINPYIK